MHGIQAATPFVSQQRSRRRAMTLTIWAEQWGSRTLPPASRRSGQCTKTPFRNRYRISSFTSGYFSPLAVQKSDPGLLSKTDLSQSLRAEEKLQGLVHCAHFPADSQPSRPQLHLLAPQHMNAPCSYFFSPHKQPGVTGIFFWAMTRTRRLVAPYGRPHS